MAVTFNDNLQVNAPKDVDNRKGKISGSRQVPYATTAEALADPKLDIYGRYLGMTIYVLKDGLTTEYWFREGLADENLVEKTTKALPDGGTTGQVLKKNSVTDGDVGWGTPVSSFAGLTGNPADNAALAEALDQDLAQVLTAGNTANTTINMDGNAVTNLPTPVDGGDAANKTYADAKEQNAKNYADLVATDVLRYAGTLDASAGIFPTTGTGTAGGIRRGDTYDISVAGTISGMEYEVGDSIRAIVANAGQVSGNWAKAQVNTQQATTTRIGISRFATDAEVLAKVNTTASINPEGFGAGIAEEKKYFKFQVAMTGETEQAILMEQAGNITSVAIAGCADLKLKIGIGGTYPVGSQTYPFAFSAGERVFFTFNYEDLLFAKCSVILKGKYN